MKSCPLSDAYVFEFYFLRRDGFKIISFGGINSKPSFLITSVPWKKLKASYGERLFSFLY